MLPSPMGPPMAMPAGVPATTLAQAQGPAPPPPKFHDVTVVTKRTYQCAKVEAVPPEEFGISRHARTIKASSYCFHDVTKTQSQLIAQGYDAEQIKKLPTYVLHNTIESIARDTVDEGLLGGGDNGINKASRSIRITEHYVRMNYEDDDGEARLYRVTTSTDESEILLRNGEPDVIEEDEIPFAAMTPVIITHRFFGRSIADLVMDIQRIKTALLRGLLDNTYLRNNPRTEVSESHATENTLDDLLVSRPGGIIRTKMPGGLQVFEHPDVTTSLMPVIQYADATREWRTGVSRQGQGVDPNALQNQVATIANQMYNASQAKVKLIARIFAETGIRDLFSLLHATIRKHGKQAESVKLRRQWVTVDPRDWKKRDDMTINVGLGTGTKTEQLAHLQVIIGAQQTAIAGGAGIVSPKNLFNSATELTKLGGHKDVDRFFTAPGQEPDENDPTSAPIEKPPDPKMQIAELKNQHDQQLAQIKQQGDQQTAQLKGQLDQQKAQADTLHQATKAQGEAALAQAKTEMEGRLAILQHQLKQRELQLDAQMKTEQHAIELRKQVSDEARAERSHHLDIAHKQAEHGMKLEEHGMKLEAHAGKSADGKPQAGPLTAALAQLAEALAAHNKPKRVVRDKNNRITHVESM